VKRGGPFEFGFVELLLGGCLFFLLGFFWGFFGAFPALFFVFFLQLGADELDDGEFGAVAEPPAGADDAGVAAGTVSETRSEVREKLLGSIDRHEKGGSLPAGVERIAFAEGDHFFGNGTSGFGAEQSGLDAFFLNQVRDEIAQDSAAMRRLLAQFRA
jgi:hypothetical protein